MESEVSTSLSTRGFQRKSRAKRPKHELFRCDKSDEDLDDISDENVDGDVSKYEECNNGPSFPSSNHKRKAVMEVTREHASDVTVLQGTFLMLCTVFFFCLSVKMHFMLYIGPGCGSDGKLVWIGRKVLVWRKGHRLSWKGIITDYLTGTEAVKIHYEGFQRFYDEIVVCFVILFCS